MIDTAPSQFTVLLSDARQGSEEARSELILIVYQDLRRLAHSYLNHERQTPSMQATAMVHEVYMRLFGENQIDWQDRSHFMIIASRQMRRILVDHARSSRTAKRDWRLQSNSTADDLLFSALGNDEIDALNEALEDLEKLYPRACQVVELRFFAGLTEVEMARVLDVSVTTVKREWRFARAWLYDHIRGDRGRDEL